MDELTYGHGGESAQASNASKTESDGKEAGTKTATSSPGATEKERQGMPNPSQREQQELKVAEEPSGYRGDNWSTAGPGGTGIRSATPENATGKINPSAPGDTGVTPGTTPH